MPSPQTPSPHGKVIAVHLNYRSRAAERGRTPKAPSYFLKPASSIAPDGEIVRPQGTELLVYEGEIAIVIGRTARRVALEEAQSHIAGYAAANDVGLHDFRDADRGSNLLSKGQDGYTPMGPVVDAAEVDPAALTITTRVNGEVVQHDGAAGMIFPFAYLVADLSRVMTLHPGDVILTGTPTGTGLIVPGDEVVVELGDGLSAVRSVVVEDREPLPGIGAPPAVSDAAYEYAHGEPRPKAPALSAEALDALRHVSTATLTVQLRRRGIRDTFIKGLRPTRPDMRLVGPARTLRYVALREDVRDADTAELNQQKQAVESIDPGEVLVMEARGQDGAGTIGDILAARVMARGGAGIVTDGGMRDSPAVAELDIPSYYQAPHAAVLGLIHFPLERDVPITCGGVLVMPGDILVGDAEGVVVVPAAMAEEVARDSLVQEQEEAWALERVKAGESVRGTYPISAERRPEFEAWLEEQSR